MRKKIMLGNWKMNHTITTAREFVETLDDTIKLADRKNIIIGVCPTYLCLNTVRRRTPFSFVVGAQDVHYLESGAFTGSISIPMLKEVGIDWCLVGHSERRMYQCETNELCNKKIHALVNNDMTCVYCVGETLEQYEQGITKDIVKEQVVEGLKDVKVEKLKYLVIAYEPVWSIGTGKNASKEIAEDICKFIRKTVSELYNSNVADSISILYGGSVKPNNIHEYMTMEDIDGALVGGASLKTDSFKELIENF